MRNALFGIAAADKGKECRRTRRHQLCKVLAAHHRRQIAKGLVSKELDYRVMGHAVHQRIAVDHGGRLILIIQRCIRAEGCRRLLNDSAHLALDLRRSGKVTGCALHPYVVRDHVELGTTGKLTDGQHLRVQWIVHSGNALL